MHIMQRVNSQIYILVSTDTYHSVHICTYTDAQDTCLVHACSALDVRFAKTSSWFNSMLLFAVKQNDVFEDSRIVCNSFMAKSSYTVSIGVGIGVHATS